MTPTRTTPAVVTVDGPSGSGKSSVSRGVAQEFDFEYLDTGAMYRAATWWVLDRGVDPGDAEAVADAVAGIDLCSGTDPAAPTIHVGTTDVSAPIREAPVTAAVSLVSAVPQVRSRMLQLQRDVVRRALADGRGIVVEGRDIGTEVLPDADTKVFLTADSAIRAERRAAEDAEADRGRPDVTATEAALRRRDRLDSTRSASPLRAAEDAVVVDATELTLQQTIDAIAALIRSRDSHD
jgi:CMP/dCMP kinase